MLKKIALLCFLGLNSFITMAHTVTPVGRWTTVDDKTGEKRADVELAIVKGKLTGTIVHRYLKPGDPEQCISCPGRFKDKPIQGLRFIWGLKQEANGTWDGGKLIDPKTGKIYHVKMTLKNDELLVRGYIGVSLIGRTQVWVHAKG